MDPGSVLVPPTVELVFPSGGPSLSSFSSIVCRDFLRFSSRTPCLLSGTGEGSRPQDRGSARPSRDLVPAQ